MDEAVTTETMAYILLITLTVVCPLTRMLSIATRGIVRRR
jgi:hypothetical protein